MALDYDKIKQNQHDENTSHALAIYTDLFMCLALIFLLMYVVASIKSGAGAIQGQIEKSRLNRENEDLKAQLKAYNALKDNSLQDQSEEEQKEYQELLNKLSMLQGEAKKEKEDLRKEATENEKKEQALNRYQQMVRNMINSQMIAKNKLRQRENIIENKKDIIKGQQNNIQNLQSEVRENEQTIQNRENQISNLKSDIQNREREIESNNQKISSLNSSLSKKINDLKNAEKSNQISKQKMEQEIAGLRRQNEKEISSLRSENARAQSKLQSLSGELSDTKSRAQAERQEMGQKISSLSGDLDKAREQLNAKRKLANDIAKNLKKAGVNADVNKETGDVLISFGDDYFAAGSSSVNPSMQKVLEKFMPKYAESLFHDKAIADKIGSVEIVGYASPTYQGKFVDPKSLSPSDKKAVKYNLDLSYKRASAIFDHVFDTNKLKFKNQDKLLGLVKVTGRSFFAEGEKLQNVKNGMPQKEFCKQYDCEKSQKVIIKFNLEDKSERLPASHKE